MALGRGGEVARLPLELVALALADADHQRAAQIGEVADRAQRLDQRRIELHVVIAGAEPDRLEIVDSAAAQRALDRVLRQAEPGLPVGRRKGGGELRARRMAGNEDAV